MKSKNLIIPALLFILLFQIQCTGASYQKEELTWQNGNITLQGTLLLPKNKPIKSVVILIHGSGNIDRTNRAQRIQAEQLAKMGIAVLHYDKRGVGKSSGDWKKASLFDLAEDAVAGAKRLEQHPGLKNVKIGFMGFSQGGWINLIAAEKYEHTAFLMTISGDVKTVREQSRYVQDYQLKNLGYDDNIIAKADKLYNIVMDVYQTGEGWEAAQTELAKYQNETWYQQIGMGLQPKDSWNWQWLRGLPLDFNPAPYYEKLQIPLFVAHGGIDPLVDGNFALQYLEKLKNQSKNITNYYDKNGAHILRYRKKVLWWNRPYWKDEYWQAIQRWLMDQSFI